MVLLQLLKIRLGSEALKLLDAPTVSYLEIYQYGAQMPQQDFSQDRLDAKWDLQENVSLWSTGLDRSSTWICRLAYALLIRTKSPYLRVCNEMVRQHPAHAVASGVPAQAACYLTQIPECDALRSTNKDHVDCR